MPRSPLSIPAGLALLALAYGTQVRAQDTGDKAVEEKPKAYFLKEPSTTVNVHPLNPDGTIDLSKVRVLTPKWYFRIGKETTTPNETVYRQITIGGTPCAQLSPMEWGKQCTNCLLGSRVLNRCDWGESFWIPDSMLKADKLIPAFDKSWSVDVVLYNVPMKIRPERGASSWQLETDFNVGSVLNVKKRLSSRQPHFLNLQVALGVQSISMSAQNNTAVDPAGEEVANTALLYGFGAGFQFGQIQVGGLLGFDLSFGDLGRDYIHQNNPWIGLGLGFSVFKPKDKQQQTPGLPAGLNGQ